MRWAFAIKTHPLKCVLYVHIHIDIRTDVSRRDENAGHVCQYAVMQKKPLCKYYGKFAG